MDATIAMLSPWQVFQDNMRPAQLLLNVFNLLNSDDKILSEGEMVAALRDLIKASDEEDLMVIYNPIFLGLVREGARLPRADLRRNALCGLLRQAVVASCTALETYLPALLGANLSVVIKARGRDSVPKDDPDIGMQFKELKFSLDEGLRIMTMPNPEEFISTKILGAVNFSYLSGSRGVAVVGKLLGIADPWQSIAQRLEGDAEALQKMVKDTVGRRNDIVHRADRRQSDPGGKQQIINPSWAKQAVDTIANVCKALDELVSSAVAEARGDTSEDTATNEQDTS